MKPSTHTSKEVFQFTISDMLFNERQKLIDALQAFHNMFIHKEGEEKKNKIKTDMIKHCEEVKAALNNSRSLLQNIDK